MDSLTVEKILAHRADRKKSGLIGCINGEDTPLFSLKGISWKPDDPANPDCFCHDCRSVWDKTGEIDLDLIRNGNERACFVYSSILPKKKDVLRNLQSKMLEDFEVTVKARIKYSGILEEVAHWRKNVEKEEQSYRNMTAGKSYEFLKFYEAETDRIEINLKKFKGFLADWETDAKNAETTLREVETKYMDAKKAFDEYFESNF